MVQARGLEQNRSGTCSSLRSRAEEWYGQQVEERSGIGVALAVGERNGIGAGWAVGSGLEAGRAVG